MLTPLGYASLKANAPYRAEWRRIFNRHGYQLAAAVSTIDAQFICDALNMLALGAISEHACKSNTGSTIP